MYVKISQQFFILICTLLVCGSSEVGAMTSPAPMDYYQAGVNHLNAYQGTDYEINQASHYFIELVDHFPDFPLGYLGLSQISIIQAYRFDKYHQMEQIRHEAMPLAVKALELGPLLPEIHLHYDLIQDLFAKHRHNQEIAQKYLELLPDESETFFILGEYLLAQDDYVKSQEFLEAALEMKPETDLQAKILKRLAHISLKHADNPQQAVDYYQQVVNLTPHDCAGIEGLGQAYIRTGEYTLAMEVLKKAYQIAPRQMIEYFIMVTKGHISEQSGQIKKAIIYFEKALDMSNHEASQLSYLLGNLYFKLKDYAKAFQKFKKVIELRPFEYSDIYYLAGRSAYSMGDNLSAQDYFKKHLQINNSGMESEWIRTHIPDLSHK